nr:tetratricopeptide repeat protein [Ardenticatenales bacterium]
RAGHYQEAEEPLQSSAALAQQHKDPYREGLALLELGHLYQKLTHSAVMAYDQYYPRAETAFHASIARFTALGAAYDLWLAQGALDHLRQSERPLVQDSFAHVQHRAASGSPEGARHLATVLWLNLIPLVEAENEALYETLSLVMPSLTRMAQSYQGHVMLRQEGLTVLFGVPVAHEDDPLRAAQSAWYIIHEVGETLAQTEVPLTAQIGISQGEVIGTFLAENIIVRGEPLQEAEALAQATPPGRVWVAGAVQQATTHLFDYAPVEDGPQLAIWELLGMRERPASARGLPGSKTRLIGREKSLQKMQEVAQILEAGAGGLIVIEGEAGIGKSRLLQEFTARMEPQTTVWVGRCSLQRSTYVFSLFSDILSHAFSLQSAQTPDESRARMEQAMQQWPKESHMARPFIEMLLGLKPSGAEGERLVTLEPDQLRQQTFVAMRTLFKALALEKPLVLLLDDLHWIDPMSAELLLFLSYMVTSVPILFVCATRAEAGEVFEDRLAAIQQIHPDRTLTLQITRLSHAESHQLLSELLPSAELPSHLQATLLERSAGNPYYIEEFVRMLIEQRYLQQHEGQWKIDTTMDLRELPLPSSLEALIRSRVDVLPLQLKQLLQTVSVIGRSFDIDLLEGISEGSSSRGALSQLEMRGMLEQTSDGEHWQFSHPLIETVVYNSLLETHRQAHHLKLAQTLEVRWQLREDESTEELAHHFVVGGDQVSALPYLVLAGERAASRSATREALEHFQQAALALASIAEPPEELRWRIIIGLGEANQFLGNYTGAQRVLEEGLSLPLTDAQQAGLYRRLATTIQKQGEFQQAQGYLRQAFALLEQPTDVLVLSEAARTLTELAWNHFLQGQLEQAKEAGERGLAYAKRAQNMAELAYTENILGGINYRLGDWEAAMHHTQQAEALRSEMGYTWGAAATRSNLGILAVAAGDWRKARTFFESSLALREELGDVEGMVIVHNNLGSLTRDQGDLGRAEFHFRESLALASTFQMAYHKANGALGLAQVLLLQQEPEVAQEVLNLSLAEAATMGAQDMIAEIYQTQAYIWLEQGQLQQADAMVVDAVRVAQETGNRLVESASWRIAAESKSRQGDWHGSRQALDHAWHVLAEITDALERGRVAMQTGRLELLAGEPSKATRHLQVAQEIFTRLGATLDLKQVTTITDEG